MEELFPITIPLPLLTFMVTLTPCEVETMTEVPVVKPLALMVIELVMLTTVLFARLIEPQV